ncbi:MAG: methionine--tRNA ligase subunit beta [Candidatus Parvarchaeum sp.]
MTKEEIDIDLFRKLDLKVGKILEAEDVEKSSKLIKLRVSLGEHEKTILSGIRKEYKSSDLIGKKIIIIDNLKPAMIMGLQSQGMLLAASDDEGNLSLLTVDKDIKEGSSIS